MAESINQCIKLSAENKINIKNAFSLEMIDFMTYMIKKQDDNMSNLQIASTSLDVSTKIYGFRVDSVHTEILKIVGGLDKQVDHTEENSNEQEDALQEGTEINLETQRKKKKKKARQKVISTVESLRTNVEVIKPTFAMIGESDLQTSDMLYQAMVPNHANSGFYQHLYNDVLVDVVGRESELRQSNCTSAKYSIPAIEDFRNLEICASYSNFEFLGWSVEDEPEEMVIASDGEHDGTNNEFRFDLDASVEQDNDLAPEPINYFDLEKDIDVEKAHGCYVQTMGNNGENIVDVRNVSVPKVTTTTAGSSKIKASEYSFVSPNVCLHWAGPSHWKFRSLARPLVSTAMQACMQAPLRKRREIKLSYDENMEVIEAKFALSQSNKLQAKTAKTEWSTESLTLPEDVHYDIIQAIKLYLHQNLRVKPLQDNDGKDDAAADLSDSGRYDYNNPNDTSDYCPVLNNDNYEEGKDDNDENDCNLRFEDDDGALINTQALTGDNLVAMPKLANKISIAYCLKAKKVDMRQLKNSIWSCLKVVNKIGDTEAIEHAEVDAMTESKQFSNVYKMLPKVLTKSNAEALSVPLSFISLLHLANEKGLKLYSLPDMSDVVVEQK